MLTKLIVVKDKNEIKIEPNLIMRGCVYLCQKLNLRKQIEESYNAAVYDVPVLSYADIYAGKICAALDRQHPRDLFDIGFILGENFNEELKTAFLVYLTCNNRPIHELLNPNLIKNYFLF